MGHIKKMKSRIIYFFIFTLTLLWSCKDDSFHGGGANTAFDIENSSWNAPVLRDTFHFNTTTKPKLEHVFSHYAPLYFGSLKDTIFVDYELCPIVSVPPPPDGLNDEIKNESDSENIQNNKTYFFDEITSPKNPPYFEIESPENLVFWENTDLEIRVDTSQTIRNIYFIAMQGSAFAFYAYPVFIINNTNKFSQIGLGSRISMILEGMDENGEWQAQEKPFPFSFFCNDGLASIVLPPSQIAVTSVKIVLTADKTKFRLRIGENTSAVFSVAK